MNSRRPFAAPKKVQKLCRSAKKKLVQAIALCEISRFPAISCPSETSDSRVWREVVVIRAILLCPEHLTLRPGTSSVSQRLIPQNAGNSGLLAKLPALDQLHSPEVVQ